MNEDYIVSFEKAWEHFETLVKGKLIEEQKKRALNATFVNILLKSATSVWFSGLGKEGLWLSEFGQCDSQKAKKITDILKNNLRVTDSSEKACSSSYVKYVVPTAGAVLGIGIAKALSFNFILQCASAAVPAAVLYPAAKSYEESKNDSINKSIIENYICQLRVYADNIKTIITE